MKYVQSANINSNRQEQPKKNVKPWKSRDPKFNTSCKFNTSYKGQMVVWALFVIIVVSLSAGC